MIAAKSPLIVIAGPTASGKSSAGLEVACALKGEIVTLDSVQIYRGLDIGSAKPDATERACAPHHLIDICDPDRAYSAAQYVRDCEAVIHEIFMRERLAILVGGTTLYLTALLHGLADLEPRDSKRREELDLLSDHDIYVKLGAVDPASAERLPEGDRFRTQRALEISLSRGRPMSERREQHRFAELHHAALVLVLCPPREILYARIQKRAVQMVENGLLEEAEELVKRYGENAPALRALGYKESIEVLSGRLARSELVEEIAKHTRQFAKRQMTYWRNEPAKRGWKVASEGGAEAFLPRKKNGRNVGILSAGTSLSLTETPSILSRISAYQHAPPPGIVVCYLQTH